MAAQVATSVPPPGGLRSARDWWWDSPKLLVAVALLTALPLLWPDIPPLVDLPGHIGRYRVELDLGASPDLQRYFGFEWALIGNLGVDLLVVPLAPLVGLELAVKLIAMSIPPLTTLGLFAVAREVHGRVPPTAFFAVPFVYGYPFNFGFLNFALSMALAVLAFALWLRLARTVSPWTRAAIFVPVSCALWVVHAFGWGVLGLLAFSAELIRYRDGGASWPRSAARAALQMASLSIPLVLMVAWRSGAAGATGDFLDFPWKALALLSAFRDRWLVWDGIGVTVAVLVIVAGLFDRHFAVSRRLGVAAAVMGVVFVALPFKLFGSAYADMRLAPYAIMIAILAIRPRDGVGRMGSRLAAAGLAFLVLRLAGNALSFGIAHLETQEKLGALAHIPRGSAVLTLTEQECEQGWALPRDWHLGGFVIARRHGFANDQWQLPGAQLLSIRYAAAAPFDDDHSAFVFSAECKRQLAGHEQPDPVRTTDEALRAFPRAAFDYVWLVEPPDLDPRDRPGLTPVWRGEDSLLYRVDK